MYTCDTFLCVCDLSRVERRVFSPCLGLCTMETPPPRAPSANSTPPRAPRPRRVEGIGRVLVQHVTLYLASGATIGPLQPVGDDPDWLTSALRIQVALALSQPIWYVILVDAHGNLLSNNDFVTTEHLGIVRSLQAP